MRLFRYSQFRQQNIIIFNNLISYTDAFSIYNTMSEVLNVINKVLLLLCIKVFSITKKITICHKNKICHKITEYFSHTLFSKWKLIYCNVWKILRTNLVLFLKFKTWQHWFCAIYLDWSNVGQIKVNSCCEIHIGGVTNQTEFLTNL